MFLEIFYIIYSLCFYFSRTVLCALDYHSLYTFIQACVLFFIGLLFPSLQFVPHHLRLKNIFVSATLYYYPKKLTHKKDFSLLFFMTKRKPLSLLLATAFLSQLQTFFARKKQIILLLFCCKDFTFYMSFWDLLLFLGTVFLYCKMKCCCAFCRGKFKNNVQGGSYLVL